MTCRFLLAIAVLANLSPGASSAPLTSTGQPDSAGAIVTAPSAGPGSATVAAATLSDPAATATSDSGLVAVTMVGIRPPQGGRLVLWLFRGSDGWLKSDRAFARLDTAVAPDAPDSLTVFFAAVPCDSSYALQVVHDKNGDGKLNMRTLPFPKPKEGVGVSNNNTRMGPPKFEQARFRVVAGRTEQRIILRY